MLPTRLQALGLAGEIRALNIKQRELDVELNLALDHDENPQNPAYRFWEANRLIEADNRYVEEHPEWCNCDWNEPVKKPEEVSMGFRRWNRVGTFEEQIERIPSGGTETKVFTEQQREQPNKCKTDCSKENDGSVESIEEKEPKNEETEFPVEKLQNEEKSRNDSFRTSIQKRIPFTPNRQWNQQPIIGNYNTVPRVEQKELGKPSKPMMDAIIIRTNFEEEGRGKHERATSDSINDKLRTLESPLDKSDNLKNQNMFSNQVPMGTITRAPDSGIQMPNIRLQRQANGGESAFSISGSLRTSLENLLPSQKETPINSNNNSKYQPGQWKTKVNGGNEIAPAIFRPSSNDVSLKSYEIPNYRDPIPSQTTRADTIKTGINRQPMETGVEQGYIASVSNNGLESNIKVRSAGGGSQPLPGDESGKTDSEIQEDVSRDIIEEDMDFYYSSDAEERQTPTEEEEEEEQKVATPNIDELWNTRKDQYRMKQDQQQNINMRSTTGMDYFGTPINVPTTIGVSQKPQQPFQSVSQQRRMQFNYVPGNLRYHVQCGSSGSSSYSLDGYTSTGSGL